MGSGTVMTSIAHSRWGASGFSRIVACHGSVRMSRYCDNLSNPAAELGTAVHELCEFCLQLGIDSYECLGFVFNKHKVDEEMVFNSQIYINIIRSVEKRLNVKPLIEQRVTISSVSELMFGTSDCLFISGDKLEVYDYKNGYGVVEVKDNKQGIYYGLGALDTFDLWGKIKTITIGIIQPRANHVDGNFRTHTYTIEEMRQWRKVYAEVFRLSNNDKSELNAGSHCEYCLAAGSCRARINRTLSLVTSDRPIEVMNKDEIEIVFNEIAAIKRNCKKIEEKALEYVRQGEQMEGYKLVNAIKRASCQNETEFVKTALKSNDKISKKDLYNLKLKSMTDCKKLISKDIVNQFFVKPDTETCIVKLTDKRPAVSVNSRPSAVGKFKNVMEK